MLTNPNAPAPGTKVGARRWPYHGAHPGCWGRPWAGVVLALDDPRAWAGSIAFPTATPDPAAVTAHVRKCILAGGCTEVPVLWTFGAEQKIYWSRPAHLRPYAVDLEEWARERGEALLRERATGEARAA
jgi:hypothetical protein